MQRFVGGIFNAEWTGKLLISALREEWTDLQWLRYCQELAGVMQREGPFHGWLVLPTGQGMTVKQRRVFSVEFRDRLRLAEFRRVAFLTDSALLRGVLTAMAWLVRSDAQTTGYKPTEWKDALSWMGEKAEFDRTEADRLFAGLCREVGVGVPRHG
jgi:hypothetical protein